MVCLVAFKSQNPVPSLIIWFRDFVTLILNYAGGGLISGVALAAKSINPTIRILAAEPSGASDVAQSKAAGKIVTLPETNTIADGLRAFLGDQTW